MRWLLGALMLVGTAAQAQDAPDGASLYGRCSACHTATGAGLPGAFPPLNRDLRELAAKREGRRYLVLVARLGLIGPLSVEGQTYRNVMPAQGLDATQIAAVLNHVGTRIAHDGPAWRAFTPAEVAAILPDAATTSAQALAALHGTLSSGQ